MFGKVRKRVPAEPLIKLPAVDENLVDVGGELNTVSLLRAYRRGSFPWTVNPVTWWSPDPRTVIEFASFRPSRSLLKLIRQGKFTITMDRAFDQVIESCAAPAPNRRTTWITPEFVCAYQEMARAGYGHSVEVWQNETLVGGVYGIALGGYFAAESMFHRVSNASKVALFSLVEHLHLRGFALLDVQMSTRITVQMGASLLPRKEFLERLRQAQMLTATFADSTKQDV